MIEMIAERSSNTRGHVVVDNITRALQTLRTYSVIEIDSAVTLKPERRKRARADEI